MVKSVLEIAGFVAFPVTLKASPSFSQPTKHYIYLKQHDPQIADENAPRSLFLVNIPVSTTESCLRHLFTTQIEGGRVEKVHFSEDGLDRANSMVTQSIRSGRKRKRMTADEIETDLHQNHLPKVFDSELHTSGATAVVVFIDKASMDLSLKAAKRAMKRGTEIIWADGMDAMSPNLGIERYQAHNSLQFPSRKDLIKCVDEYMTAYAQMEETRSRENARKRQIPDDDGFVTVTKGAKRVMRKEDLQGEGSRAKQRSTGLQDFYRFQMREKRKEEQNEMLRKFEQDKRKVEEMRLSRGKFRPE